jgi:sec-independent protein translocase protein TatA
MRIGITEIIVILAVAFILFGGVKLTGLGKALGRSIRDFRDEIKNGDKEADKDTDKSTEKSGGDGSAGR